MRYLLLLFPCFAFAGSVPMGNVEVCGSVVQAVEWSRWEGNYSVAETVKSFEDWAAQADKDNSSLRHQWYVPAVMQAIESAYKAEDRGEWRRKAMRDCMMIAGGEA